MKKKTEKYLNNIIYYTCVLGFIVVSIYLVFTLIPLDKKRENYTVMLSVKKSPINGVGLFTNKHIKNGTVILHNIFRNSDPDVLRRLYGGKYTQENYFKPYLAYVNHCSSSSNCEIVKEGDIYNLVSIKDIPKDGELLGNYDITNSKFNWIAPSKSNFTKC